MTETASNNTEKMPVSDTNYSRIAKNTVFLFFRMILTMGIGLYTSRVLLNALGVEDYGIYNIVGGFVAMFAIVSGALTSAISRFITFELGRGDSEAIHKTFQCSVTVMVGISAIVIIIGETIGLWLLYNKLVIPEARLDAAFWVFQFAIATFVLNLLSTPYNACIISHEKMQAFAYISIFEAVSKLLICFAIIHSPFDRLVFYAVLLCLVGIIIRVIYVIYSKKNFTECRGHMIFDKKIVKSIFHFAGWSFIGSSGWILRGQGGTILLNLFGGPVVNAANAIAVNLSGTVSGFVNCFTTAVNPQITKNYANGSFHELNKLLIYGPKISFYLLFIIVLPMLLNTKFILSIWLGTVPEHTVDFVRLVLIVSLIDVISMPLITAKNATGRIRNYQLVVGGIQLLAVPLAYVFLKLGARVEMLYVAYIIVSAGCLLARIYMLDGEFPHWSSTAFLVKVCLSIIIVAAIASVLPALIASKMHEGWICLGVTTAASIVSCAATIYFLGLDKNERKTLASKIIFYVKKFKK